MYGNEYIVGLFGHHMKIRCHHRQSPTHTDTYIFWHILTYCDGAFFMGGVDVVKGSLRSQTMRPGCKSSKFTAFRLGMVENVQKNDWKILECSDMFGKYACIMCVHMQPPASKSKVAFARTWHNMTEPKTSANCQTCLDIARPHHTWYIFCFKLSY